MTGSKFAKGVVEADATGVAGKGGELSALVAAIRSPNYSFETRIASRV